MGDRRYKSNLFNFFWRQSLQLQDLWQKKARQAKVSSIWGLQAGLYPLYLLFQTSRLAGRTLRQADTQGQRWLRAVVEPEQDSRLGAVDRPIQRVLRAIQLIVIPPEPPLPSTQFAPGVNPGPQLRVSIQALPAQPPTLNARAQRWAIGWWHRAQSILPRPRPQLNAHGVALQGVACDLSHRYPILVAAGNEVLDVLTANQQTQIQQLMAWEVAHYHRQRRLVQQLPQLNPWHHRQLPTPTVRPQMWFPIQGFHQLMAWIQTGPIATTVNLFAETHRLPPTPLLPGEPWAPLPVALPADLGKTLNQLSPKLTPEAIALVDTAIANWESSSWEAMGPTATQLSHWIEEHLQPSSPPPSPSPSPLTTPCPPSVPPWIEKGDTSTLQSILRAMIWVPNTVKTALSALSGSSAPPQQPPPTAAPTPSIPIPDRTHEPPPTTHHSSVPVHPLISLVQTNPSAESLMGLANAQRIEESTDSLTHPHPTIPPRPRILSHLRQAIAPLWGSSASFVVSNAPAIPPPTLATNPGPPVRIPSPSPQTPPPQSKNTVIAPTAHPVPPPVQHQDTAKHQAEIEVEAVFVSYEQHPLERLLHWLDRAISWLETGLAQVVQTWWPRIKSYIQQRLPR